MAENVKDDVFEELLTGRGRQLSRRQRRRCLNTRNSNFATVFQHDAAAVDNPNDFTSAQQLKMAG